MDKGSEIRGSLLQASNKSKRVPASRLKKILGRDWAIALPFVLPLIIIMGGLILWPFINAIFISLTTRSLVTRTETFVGLANYKRLLEDTVFISSVQNTLVFTLAAVFVKFVFGMCVALLLNNNKLPFRSILTGLILLPWIVPEVVTALTWRSIFDPVFGGLNPILQGLGIINRDVAWLAEPGLALPSVIAVNVWKGIPFFTILLLAGLKGLDKEQYEAAEVDGANALQRFRHITLPGLRYVMIVTGLLSFILTFNTFGLIYLMTGGGPGGATRVYSILAYERAIVSLRFGPGTAVAFSMAPVMAILIFFLAKFMRPDEQVDNNVKISFGDRIFDATGKLVGLFFDLLLLPLSLAMQVWNLIVRQFRKFRTSTAPLLNKKQQVIAGILTRYALLLPLLIFVLFPFYWIIVTSFKTDLQIQQFVSIYWPDPWTTEQYHSLIYETPYLLWFRNTIIVATSSTAISVAIATLAAYALARLRFLGAGSLTTVLLITYLLPGALLFIPLYRILTELGIINSYAALIVTYPTFLMPFATWVMLGYFRSIPPELEESAMIDGATRFGAFWRITLPLSMPALLSITLFAFTNAWNEFLFAFVFITSERFKTLPVGLQLLVFGDIYPWGRLMAASLIMAIPVVIIYTLAQQFLVEGLTAGSIKG